MLSMSWRSWRVGHVLFAVVDSQYATFKSVPKLHGFAAEVIGGVRLHGVVEVVHVEAPGVLGSDVLASRVCLCCCLVVCLCWLCLFGGSVFVYVQCWCCVLAGLLLAWSWLICGVCVGCVVVAWLFGVVAVSCWLVVSCRVLVDVVVTVPWFLRVEPL